MHAVSFGYDSYGPPNLGGGLAGIQALHRWLLDHTTIRHAGGYTSIPETWGTANPVARGSNLLEPLWLMGFGLSLFDNSGIQNGASGAPAVGAGTTQAAAIRKHAHESAPNLDRAVVYVDNEDVPQPDFDHLLTYYRELFHWLEAQPPDTVRTRPGIYLHMRLVKPLLAEFPYLYVCDVAYPCHVQPPTICWDVPSRRNPYNTTDPYSIARAAGGQIAFDRNRWNALPSADTESRGRLIPASGSGRGPKQNWQAWATIYQFEGTNRSPLARGRQTVAGTGLTFDFTSAGWSVDYESSLVDDPSYPSVSPRIRLLAGSAGLMAQLDRVNPPPGATRQASRTVHLLQPAGASAALIEQPRLVGLPAPGVRPQWIQTGTDVFLVTPRLIGFELLLETHLRDASGAFKPVSMTVVDPPPGLLFPVHTPWSIAALSTSEAVAFVVANDGSLTVSKGSLAAPAVWPCAVHAAKSVHQYSELTSVRRGTTSVDAFYIGANRALHTAWWNSSLKWPSGTDLPIGAPDVLLPTTKLSAVSPDADTIVVFGVGYDLRLQVASWSNPGPWVGPVSIGLPGELLSAHTDVCAAWNPDRRTCEVLVLGNDLALCLYQVSKTATGWTSARARTALFTPTAGPDNIAAVAPSPFGDLDLTIASRKRIVAGVFSDSGGSFAQWLSSDSAADPAATPWSAPARV